MGWPSAQAARLSAVLSVCNERLLNQRRWISQKHILNCLGQLRISSEGGPNRLIPVFGKNQSDGFRYLPLAGHHTPHINTRTSREVLKYLNWNGLVLCHPEAHLGHFRYDLTPNFHRSFVRSGSDVFRGFGALAQSLELIRRGNHFPRPTVPDFCPIIPPKPEVVPN